MSQIVALLILILSLLEGGAGTQPQCSVERWEDRSAVYTCVTEQHTCEAWVDAETQRLAGVDCK